MKLLFWDCQSLLRYSTFCAWLSTTPLTF
jgi:hypothetical protein